MLSIILLFGQALSQEAQDQQFLTIGKSYQGYSLLFNFSFIFPRSNEYGLYQFNVPNMTNSSDLVVMVKSYNPLADPNIYISRKIASPLSASDADVLSCEAKGLDTCVLTKDQVVTGETLYLAVVSQYPCRFQLRIDFDEELYLKENDFLTFKMNGTTQSKIINFNIGQLFGNESEIEIFFVVSNLDQLEEPVLVYMNYEFNGIPSNDKYDFAAKDIMDNKIIELNSVQFSSFSRYYILVQAQQGAILQVYTQTNSQIKQLYLYESKQQVVEKGSYDFFVTDIYNLAQDSNLYIQLTPFQGYASLFVNPNEQPPLLQNYLWTEKDQIGEMIEITSQQLIEKNINLTKLYIGVYGEEFCTYEIQVKYAHYFGSELIEYLQRGIQNFLIVEKQKLMTLQILEFREKDFMLMVNFKNIIGKPHFILTNCSELIESCPKVTWDLVTNQKQYEALPNDIFIYSTTLNLDHVRLACSANELCRWNVILYMDQEEQSNGKLAISYHFQEDQLNLIENTPHKSSVDKDSTNYYKFTIQENDQIHRVQFLVTTITGEVTMYMSTSKKYPNENSYDQKSISNMINLGGRFGNTPTAGTYYIAILGNTPSKYTITVWAIRSFLDFRQQGKFPWHYIQLYKGDPQSHELYEDEVGLFKIDLLQYENEMKSPVTVSLQVDYGSLEMFAFKQPESDIDKYDWKSTSFITIEREDPQYPEILYIRIQLNQKYSSYASYRIVFQFEYDTVWLFLGNQHFSYLSEQHSQTFLYQMEMDRKNPIIITKQAQTYDQQVLTMEIYEDPFLNIEFSKSKNSVKISVIEQNYNCYIKQECIFSVLITITAHTNLFYSLLVSEENGEIQLFEDQPLTKNVPVLSDSFYIYASKDEVSIICSSYSVELTMLAKIVQDFDEPYPSLTTKDYDKISKRHLYNYQSSIYFSGEDLEQFNCKNFCLIKLTLLKDDSHINSGFDYQEYTIQYNSKAIKLKEGESLFGQIQNNGIKYYKVNLVDDKQNLMILVTPISYCEIDAYISKHSYPTPLEYDWSSNQYLGEALIIQAGNDKHPNMSGNYIIGVVGQNDCQFQIQYTVGNMQLYTIYSNNPQKLFISADDIIYLKYDGIIVMPISIFLHSYSEQAVMFIDEIEILNSDFSYLRKDLSQFKYNNNGQGFKQFAEINDVIEGHSLVIALKGNMTELLSIQVNSVEQYISLQEGVIYTNHVKEKQLLFFNIFMDQDDIIVWINMKIGFVTASYQLSEYFYDENLKEENYQNFPLFQEGYKNRLEIKKQSDKSIVYLKVTGTSDAIFTINFIQGNKEVIPIKTIHPEYFVLRARDVQGFKYTSMYYNSSIGNPDQKTFSITIGSITGFNNIEGQIKKELPDITVYSTTNDYKISHGQFEALDDIIYLEYVECDTQYNILIQSNSQIEQLYYIQIGTFDIKPLSSKLKQMQSNHLHESTYWVTPSGYQSNKIFYDFQFCGGLFSIYVGSDLDQLRKGQYDRQIITDYNRKTSGILENPKRGIDGEIYFKIQLYKIIDSTQDKASYTLRTYAVNDQVVFPYKEIHPGDYGVIQYSIEQFNDYINLIVTFAPLNYTYGDEGYTVDKIEYYLMLQQRDELDDSLINYCSEPYEGRKVIVEQHNKSEEMSMIAAVKNKKGQKQQNLAVTVLAKAHLTLLNEEKITLEYNYESQHVRWRRARNEQKIRRFIILVISLGVIIILITAVFLLLRYRKRRLIQKYEVSDSATAFGQGIELNYRGLVD